MNPSKAIRNVEDLLATRAKIRAAIATARQQLAQAEAEYGESRAQLARSSADEELNGPVNGTSKNDSKRLAATKSAVEERELKVLGLENRLDENSEQLRAASVAISSDVLEEASAVMTARLEAFRQFVLGPFSDEARELFAVADATGNLGMVQFLYQIVVPDPQQTSANLLQLIPRVLSQGRIFEETHPSQWPAYEKFAHFARARALQVQVEREIQTEPAEAAGVIPMRRTA
jgi:hypothetical protein